MNSASRIYWGPFIPSGRPSDAGHIVCHISFRWDEGLGPWEWQLLSLWHFFSFCFRYLVSFIVTEEGSFSLFSSFWTVEMQLIFIYGSNNLLTYQVTSKNSFVYSLRFCMWTITQSENSDSLVSSLRILMPRISFTCFTAWVRTSQIALSTVILGTPAHSCFKRVASQHPLLGIMFAVNC